MQTSRVSNRTKQAHAVRELVFSLLGGQCAKCSVRHGLEVDIKVSGGERHHDVGSLKRWQFYLLAAQQQRAQLLCVRHHREKSREDLRARRTAVADDAAPVVARFAELSGTFLICTK